ncbi:MAG TPA: MFS transporter [Candidatus Limnocylindria bacterium]|nr:MFS transporter [Candidatus Limnocylindria bacterium]
MIRTSGTARAADPPLFTRQFVSLSAAVLAFFISGAVFLPVVPRFTVGPLRGDDLAVGLVLGAFAIASLAMRPFAGRFADRRGRRMVLIVGAVITVAASAGHLVVDSIPLLIVMRVLLGIGEALFFVAGLAAATDLAPDRRRGEAISLISLSLYLGLAVGPMIGEAVLASFGFTAAWIAATVIAVIAVGLSWFAPETLPPQERSKSSSGQSLLHRRGLEPGLLLLCGLWGMGPFFAFLPLLADELGLGGAGTFFAIFALVVVGLRIVGARLPDQIGAARLSGTALVVSAVGMALAWIVPTFLARDVLFPGLVVATTVFAVGVAFTFPAIMAMAVIGISADERGAVVGTAGLFTDAAFGLSPAILGLLAGAAGYPSTFLVSAVIAAIGAAWLLMRRPGHVATAAA